MNNNKLKVHHNPKLRLAMRYWAKNIMSSDFVIMDTETTGLTSNAQIVQIGIVDKYNIPLLSSLIKPTCEIDIEASDVTGITMDIVKDAPSFVELYPEIKSLLKNKIIVGYNIAFDARMLNQTCSAFNLETIDFSVECVMKNYAKYWGDKSKKNDYKWQKLAVACEQMGIPPIDTHDATGDCILTYKLLEQMATRFVEFPDQKRVQEN